MILPPSLIFLIALAAIANKQFVDGVSAPRKINLSFVSNVDATFSSFSAAFLNPVKSFHKYFQRPSHIGELQFKILTLEREIRHSKEESRQLRALLNHQRAERRKHKHIDTKQSMEVERILRDQIKSLNTRIEELSQIKGEMDALLKQEKEYSLKLEQSLQDEREDKANLIQKHRVELDDSRQKIISKSEEKMKEMEHDIVSKMTLKIEQLERNYQEALAKNAKLEKEKQETEQAIIKEKANCAKLEKEKLEAEQAIIKEKANCAKLEKEKQEALQAVENEKTKMRKLVKVLANKEKQGIEARERMSSNAIPLTQTATSSKARTTRKIISQRGSKP